MLKDNLKAAFSEKKLYVKEVAARSGVKKATIDNWLSEAKTKEPRAVDLYSVCRAVSITMEQAIDGEAGAEYVRAWAQRDGKVWQPPARIADIVEDIKNLEDRDLDIIRGTIQPMRKREGNDLKKVENP
ncbi:MAG: hypothetical protein LBQ88_12755 [Treponema sp.]|jgi:transcriptional regulator with XRE-family HTH domain|nr:hypothetical protein [Treponema sp.]